MFSLAASSLVAQVRDHATCAQYTAAIHDSGLAVDHELLQYCETHARVCTLLPLVLPPLTSDAAPPPPFTFLPPLS